jgi:hypothetical protein
MDEVIVELGSFFESVEQPLCEVLDATECRERWLHGEMYRWFKRKPAYRSFRVNSFRLGEGKTADFDSEHPFPFVGEAKILGAGYETKCITGGALRPLMARLDRPIELADRRMIRGWSLLSDFFRLLDGAMSHGRAAYLVLVAAGVHESDDLISRALRCINFARPSHDIAFGRGVIRIWRVYATHAMSDHPSEQR